MLPINNQSSILDLKDFNTLDSLKKKTSNKNTDNLKKACNDFESFFTQQLLDISTKNINIAGEETGSDIYKSMYNESLSKNTQGNLGISNLLFEFLSKK